MVSVLGQFGLDLPLEAVLGHRVYQQRLLPAFPYKESTQEEQESSAGNQDFLCQIFVTNSDMRSGKKYAFLTSFHL